MNRKRKSLMALGMTAVLAAAIPIGANAAEVTTGNNPQAANTIKITSSAALSSTNSAIAPNVRFQMLEGTPLTMTSTALPTMAIRIGSDHNALLTFLGIDEATYLEELKSGKSELEIAEAHGITKAQLMEFETNAFNASLDQAVKDGKLTEDQASKMKEGFASSLEQRLEGKGPFLTKSVQAIRIDSQSLEEAVKSGKLTQEQADRMKERQDRPGTLSITTEGSAGFAVGGPVDFTLGGVPFGEGAPSMGKAIKIGVDLKELLAFLGTDEATYMEQLKSGKTPLEIAEANGKTKEELLAFEADTFAASVDQAVQDGSLTEEQASKMKADFASHAEDRLEGKNMVFRAEAMGNLAPGAIFGQTAFVDGIPMATKAIRIGADFKELLAFLGIDEATYMEQLKSGKTPLEIAEANGKTKEELLAFESASFAESVDQAVKDGQLSEEEAAKMKADYAEHAEERIEGKPMIFHTTTFDGTASGGSFSQVTSTPAITVFQ